MPTKMNKVRQQPYVPSGEDGGEYRQYGYGGSKEQEEPEKKKFVNFKKKDKDGIEVKVDKNDKSNNNAKDFIDFINKTQTHNSKEFNQKLIGQYDLGFDEGKQLINNVAKNGSLSYSEGKQDVCFLVGGSVQLSPTGIGSTRKSKYYSDGGVFYHETYHAIDGNYTQPYTPKNRWDFRGSASETIITSNGKTLCDTLKGRQKPPMSERLQQAKEDLAKFEQDYYNKNYPELANNKKELDDIRKEAENTKEYQDILKKKNEWEALSYDQKVQSGIGWGTYRNQLSDIVNDYKKDEQQQLRGKIVSAQLSFEKEKCRVWGDVSDMFCMQGYGFVFGMGHSSSYAKDTNRRGHEFFAECGSAENTNPESLKLIKKYFPEGYKAYRDIIDGIKSGKYKTMKQQQEKEGAK